MMVRGNRVKYRAVIATGRFQTVHVGSLAYLQSAQAIADDLACDLFVLSGPSDAELQKHAQKGQGRNVNRPLSFAERQLLLSIMLAISPVNILVHQSTPHHGDPDLQSWVNNFSVPLVSSGITGESDIISGAGAHLLLTVVIKKSDFKVYRQGDQKRHYAHYLREKYRGLDIMNLSRAAAERTKGTMRPESDLPGGTERYAFIPPIVAVAEHLTKSGRSLLEAPCVQLLRQYWDRFGSTPQPDADVSKLVDSDLLISAA